MDFPSAMRNNFFDGVHAPKVIASNARSLLKLISIQFPQKKFWLPAYICDSLAIGVDIGYYPLETNTLSPDIDFIEKKIPKGDVILFVDYFGYLPLTRFITYVKNNRDYIWVEDRCQLLSTAEIFGDFTIFSLRKVVGVLDGAALIGKISLHPSTLQFEPLPFEATSKVFLARILRNLSDKQSLVASAYKLMSKCEREQSNYPFMISPISRFIFDHLNLTRVQEIRRSNYNHVLSYLNSVNLENKLDLVFGKLIEPFDYPLFFSEADSIHKKWKSKALYAARHWRKLPSPILEFPYEHKLSERQLSIPTNHQLLHKDLDCFLAHL